MLRGDEAQAASPCDITQSSAAKVPDVPVGIDSNTIRDRRNLLWVSIDNDDSHDLDQLTVAEAMSTSKVKILVALADVDSLLNPCWRLRSSTDTPASASFRIFTIWRSENFDFFMASSPASILP